MKPCAFFWTSLQFSPSSCSKIPLGPKVRRLYSRWASRTFGPSGIFEQDDGENWSEVQANAHGFITNRVALNYQMGLGSEREDGRHPGMTSELYSDAAGRSFYARWRELMNTPAWHEEER